ncbi:uncharacterized protein At4g14450, chloroplastic-like [Ananas comosus]|uniref:Uncharacterized protein At4g14450, chloroplastic-like n=1 Tax=Ananas comosus TaxID=4615 RepID=A0A6P5FPW5_ANACO|nr:uncharacterized protein At4g14450, chloroplastic-like [Ananas comosus]
MDATEESMQKNSKLQRQKSRLQMQAPSAIQVGRAEPAAVAEWRAAIPLLSPLDVSTAAAAAAADEVKAADGGAWRHPAAPFYYEPVPGNAPAFVFSYCA